MKKIALLLALIFLVSCGEADSAPQVQTPAPETVETPAPEVVEPAPEKQTVAAPEVKPEEKPKEKPPAPAEEKTPVIPEKSPEPSSEPEVKTLCTISVTCGKLPGKLDKLEKEKRALVPADGVILDAVQVEFTEGETVFDVLKRCLEEKGIALEYREDLVYKSVYVEGIGGIFEKDCGAYSGWMYKVNGTPPTYGASEYKLKNGDRVEFYYSC